MTQDISKAQHKYTAPLVVLTFLFFMWGFLRSMTDVIIPYFRKIFSLNYAQAMLVQFFFLGAYFVGSLAYYLLSVNRGDPIRRFGYKRAILFGISLSAMGCLLFWPAASLVSYPLFLCALLVLGLGFTALEITANAFVALLGSEETSSARLNLTQAFNSLGTTLGPLIGGYVIFSLLADAQGHVISGSVKYPYLVFACVFAVLGFVIARVRFPAFFAKKEAVVTTEKGGAFRFPQLRLGILGIFFYNGAETGIGSFIIVLLEQKFGFSDIVSKNYVALYWGGAMIGRFLAPVAFNAALPLAKRLVYMMAISVTVFCFLHLIVPLDFGQVRFLLLFIGVNILGFVMGKKNAALTLFLFALVSAALILIGVLSDNHFIIYTFLAIGLFNSIMFSNIYTLAITGLGRHASQGSSLLIMAVLGGGALSLLQGVLADRFGVQSSFALHIVSYLYVAFFGWYCYRKFGRKGQVGKNN